MNAQKTPVALLQEVMMQHAKPLPQYSIVSLPGPTLGFQCTCTVGDIKATATAYSKQEAKHRSAQNILSVLKIPGPVGSPVKINSTPHVNANAVSKLNELASQNGVPYPLYAEVSSGSLRQVSQFAVRCSFGSLEAVGTASNKKEAKQRAASEILVLLKETKLSEIFPKNTITAVASDVASAQDELAGELYKKLSFREREKSNEVQEKCYGTVQTSVVNISSLDSVFTAKCALEAAGANFKVETFQEKPLILMLSIKNTSQVLMETGEVYEEVMLNLLRRSFLFYKMRLNSENKKP